jgi:alanyl-tRNA synthetase
MSQENIENKVSKKLTVNEIRQKYLDFFEGKAAHTVIDSSRLVPENDPTTLFTGSGMQPMLPYLLGQKHPLGTRIADSQKCFRSQDIEEVGDNRHTTFFEMLGNWSLGDYFKEEQIQWMWEFLTKELGLDPRRLYFSAFIGDETLGIPKDTYSAEKWQELYKSIGIEAGISDSPEERGLLGNDRIFYYNAKKNWWSRSGVPANMPVGEPGGPDTEMFYDFAPELGMKSTPGTKYENELAHVNSDCGRFMEIGNNVFMEYICTEKGFEFLAQKNVDFGGGLERMAAAVNNDSDVFNLDVFAKAKSTIEEMSGKKYEPKPDANEILGADKLTQSFRVILDHMRAATFLIGDGVLPGNKDQNYFVRRLLRRAVRNGKNLGIKENFCKNVADSYIEVYKNHYANLSENREAILKAIDDEESKFKVTLDKGVSEFMKSKIFTDKIDDLNLLSKDLFGFYQSYGLPFEVMLDILNENNIKFNYSELLAKFEEERKSHSELSRAGAGDKFKGGLADSSEAVTKYHTATHLLHQALKEVLGESVNQKGSNITAERLRFDFSHDTKMTEEEVKQTEGKVNSWIQMGLKVRREEMDKAKAEERKPIHLFGEKYGDIVSIYTISENENQKVRGVDAVSVEFCGGPHVESTVGLGHFKIIKEEAVSAGVRRIKAVLE